MNKIAVVLLLLAATGCSQTARLPADAYQAEADAVVALTFAADPVLTAPDPDDSRPNPSPDDWKRPGVECRNCYGTGRTGDGNAPCRVCGGDGKIDEQDMREVPPEIGATEAREESASNPRTIVMHVTAKTVEGWPQQWWRETRPRLVADGWDVTFQRDDKLDPPLEPNEAWFEVCEGDMCRELKGEQPYEAFK